MQDNEQPKKAFIYSLWAPPIILGLILLFILIYLLVPGTLLYPPKTTGSGPNITIDQNSSAEIESNLKRQIAELEKLSAEGVCTDNGFSLPDNTLSLFPPNFSSDPAEKFSVLPPSSKIFNHADLNGNEKPLSDLLNETTVFVMVQTNDGDFGHGSGFFISEDLILTNQHVIEGAKNNIVEIVRPNSDQIFSAQILKASENFETANQDYAVLRSNIKSENYLRFGTKVENLSLMPVVAAGFPGDVIDSFMAFDSEGTSLETNGLPLFQTNGVVNAVQPLNAKNSLVMHSAEISQGNSGGPLVNACGEVLAINTFIYNETDVSVRTLNIALHADGIKKFLSEAAISFDQSTQECSPKVITNKVAE